MYSGRRQNLPRHDDRAYPDAHLPAAGHQLPDEAGWYRADGESCRPARPLAHSHLRRAAGARLVLYEQPRRAHFRQTPARKEQARL